MSIYDNHFLSTQFAWISKSFITTIPYPYNINIFSHLYVLIKRFRSGTVIQDDGNAKLKPKYQSLRQKNANFWKISNDVIQNTADYLHCDIPEIESYYLLEYLMSMRYNQDFELNDSISAQASQLADYYLDGFKIDRHDGKAKSLKSDLVGHIRPMYNRLRNGIAIANKLLGSIKAEYRQTFDQLRKLSDQAYQDGLLKWEISDDEIGFLTLYFAKYFEETSMRRTALVMCASGVGTSKLLYAKIHRNFPDLELVGIISKSAYEEHYRKYQNVDLIISTIPVEAMNHEKVILSSVLFNVQDQNRLSRYLNESSAD